MQLENYYADGERFHCSIPDPDVELMPEVRWGNAAEILTPAFWRFRYITDHSIRERKNYRLGDTLREEVVACLLGGHGIVGEIGLAAFERLRSCGIIDQSQPSQLEIEAVLQEPMLVNDRTIRYRFPKQKAKYIAAALRFLDLHPVPETGARELREWLTQIPGIGFKTGAWIVRNWSDSDEVAILDIHIHRAGVIAGFYAPNDDISRRYRAMERTFLDFADAVNVPAGILDNQIWNIMRIVPFHVRTMLISRGAKSGDKCGLPRAN